MSSPAGAGRELRIIDRFIIDRLLKRSSHAVSPSGDPPACAARVGPSLTTSGSTHLGGTLSERQEVSGVREGRPRVASTLCADQWAPRRHSWEGTTVSYIDVAIPAIAGIFALAWPQMFLRKPPDERKVRRVRQFGMLFLAIAAVYLAMRLAGV